MDTYSEAHLFVAAIRVLQHQKKNPPSIEEVCSMIGSSTESGYALCRTLKKAGIVETLEDPYSVKLFVANHLELETMPRQQNQENSLAKELEKFKKEKSSKDKKFADMQAELEKKKKHKLSEIEAKFKAQMEKYKKD
jgi:hypothetical protein